MQSPGGAAADAIQGAKSRSWWAVNASVYTYTLGWGAIFFFLPSLRVKSVDYKKRKFLNKKKFFF